MPNQTLTETNKELARRYIKEVWDQHNANLVDEFFAADAVRTDPATGVERGRDAIKQVATALLAAFPDIRFTIELQTAEDDSVVTRWSCAGTHLGDFQGIAPTGKQFTNRGSSTYRYADGLIVEENTFWDALGLLRTIGVVQV